MLNFEVRVNVEIKGRLEDLIPTAVLWKGLSCVLVTLALFATSVADGASSAVGKTTLFVIAAVFSSVTKVLVDAFVDNDISSEVVEDRPSFFGMLVEKDVVGASVDDAIPSAVDKIWLFVVVAACAVEVEVLVGASVDDAISAAVVKA